MLSSIYIYICCRATVFTSAAATVATYLGVVYGAAIGGAIGVAKLRNLAIENGPSQRRQRLHRD